MTKVAVMQPYAFPYFGYLQLMKAVDHFVFMDDVTFIKKGFMNRNKIMSNGEEQLFTIPVHKISQNKKINEHYIGSGWSAKLIKSIQHNYQKSPYFEEYSIHLFPLIKELEDKKFSDACVLIFETITDILNITSKWHLSSSFDVEHLKAEQKIITICNELSADMYINPIGGLSLDFYTQDIFNPIQLRFIKRQDSLPSTSIIDLLFSVGAEELRNNIDKYELINK